MPGIAARWQAWSRQLGPAFSLPASPSGGPPAIVSIPYSWLSRPLRDRPDKPVTSASVSQFGGTSAYQVDADSQTEYGENPFTATLHTACDADPANLAHWALAYRATQPGVVPRARFSSLPVVLSKRAPAEIQLLLDVRIGQRIRITGAPATWPPGKTEQVVEGIRHSIGALRTMELITVPIIGTTAGAPGPWFKVGSSVLGGPDAVPF